MHLKFREAKQTTSLGRVATCLSILILAQTWTGEAARGESIGPPNFILILADDLGYGDLGCYGHPTNRTPHIDQLAREGMRFTDFHSNGPMCSPTRAALLTGKYQSRFGIPFERALSAKAPEIGLPPDSSTLPNILRDAGYATGMFGKWHLGYQHPHLPTDHGFDTFRGLLTGDGDHHSQIDRSGRKDWYHGNVIKMEEGYTTELITRHSIDFMQKNKERPFFLYVSHLAIHFPWQAPGEDAHRVEGTDYWNLKKLGPHPEGSVGPVVQEMVEALDHSVGAIMAALCELNLDDNTFVIFVSDNGGYLNYDGQFQGEISSNGPLRGEKGEVWEGGHRVPAIARWPGRIPAGTTSDQSVMTMDFLPTCARLARARAPLGIDGKSILPVLFENASIPHRDLFWRMDGEKAIRRGPWKLVVRGAREELFNLDLDIGEQNNVAEENPAIVNALTKSLDAWEQEVDNS